jgi:hypothetical protein
MPDRIRIVVIDDHPLFREVCLGVPIPLLVVPFVWRPGWLVGHVKSQAIVAFLG